MAQLTQQAVGRPLQRLPGHDGRHGHRVGPPGPQGVSDARHGQQRVDGHHRVGRGNDYCFGVGQRLNHPGSRSGGVGPGEPNRPHGYRVAQAHEVLLKTHLVAGSLALVQGDHGGHRVLGHRQQRGLQAPRLGDLGGDGGQAGPLGQAARPVEVGTQVPVAKPEPRRSSEAVKSVHGLPRLSGQTPAGLRVTGLGQRVGDRVQIGRHVQPVEDHVVGRVHDGRDPVGGHGEDQAPQQAGRPHAPSQNGDHDALRSAIYPVRPAGPTGPRGGPGRRPPSSRPAR